MVPSSSSGSGDNEELIQRVLKIADNPVSKLFHKYTRLAIRVAGYWYFKVQIQNGDALNRPKKSFIIAPVHRSNLDGPLINAYCRRRVRSFAKAEMFKSRLALFVSSIIGAVPVDREKNDRKALVMAEKILGTEEPLLLFPEGVRGSGNEIQNLYSGCAWLSIKTQVPVVPVGISGTETAMPSGKKIPKRQKVYIEVGDALMPPEENSKLARESFTQQIKTELQKLQNVAVLKSAR